MLKRALLAALLALAGLNAHAQNAPLSGLAPRGTVQPTDIIPILPAGGAQLEQTTVAQLAIAGSGTVTSVGLAMPAPFNCTGSPVTAAGTITCTVGAQSANTVYAGPTSGGAATPTFRALVTADFPASGVTAGSYTDTNFTVDATGRITAASSGAVGGGGTFYVNHSTGSDSNNCTASGTACLTIGHALSLVPPFITGAYTINVADGTYAECLDLGGWQGIGNEGSSAGTLSIIGDIVTPANVLLTGSCSAASGTQTATFSIFAHAGAPLIVKGLKTAPASMVTVGVWVDFHAFLTIDNIVVSNDGIGIGAWNSAVVRVGTTVTVNFHNYGAFIGLTGGLANIGSATPIALVLTPESGLGTACLHAENGGQIDLENGTNSGSITCPGGAAQVTTFLEGDTNSTVFDKYPSTAVNSSTPTGSAVIRALHGANVFLLGTITATNWTNSCTAYEAGSADQGPGGRTFTSVGATNVVNTGTCTLF